MVDVFTKEKRSEIMSRIRGKETKLELKLFEPLVSLSFEYQPKKIYGKPDYGHRARKVVVFLDSCFWHGCPLHYKEPQTNVSFWRDKITRNKQRDKEVARRLVGEGWKVLRFWEHDLEEKLELVLKKVVECGGGT